jgi:hypothetical protein
MTNQEIVTPSQGLTKRCSQCKKVKSIDQFYTTRSECKNCTASYRKRKGAANFCKEGSKICAACNQLKDYCQFRKDSWKPDGHSRECKTCRNARNVEYQRKNVVGRRNKAIDFQGKSSKEIKAIYDEVYELQQGCCAICRMPEVKRYRGRVVRLAMDHCHVTGKFRGLLCFQCNVLLARFKDNPETFQRGVDYLQKD